MQQVWKIVNDNQLLLGVLLGWLFARFWEELRKPNLELQVALSPGARKKGFHSARKSISLILSLESLQ